MSRTVRVYRIAVTYPPGALEYGWEPPEWREGINRIEAAQQAWIDERTDRDPLGGPFYPRDYNPETGDWIGWPVNRMYFSRANAERRADLFRRYGATAAVDASDPVTWPSGNPGGD